MKRMAFLAAASCLCACVLTGTGRADFVYGFFSGGQSGPPLVEFTTPSLVVSGTDLNPITLTEAVPGLDTTGELQGLFAPGFQPSFLYSGADGSGMFATLNDPVNDPSGNPSNQFPTVVGVYALVVPTPILGPPGNSGPPPALGFVDTLVISSSVGATATPEPGSLVLLGVGALVAAGYGWRQRERAAA